MNSPTHRCARLVVRFVVLLSMDHCFVAHAEDTIDVAVVKVAGVGSSLNERLKAIDEHSDKNSHVSRITAKDIEAGELTEFDVIVQSAT